MPLIYFSLMPHVLWGPEMTVLSGVTGGSIVACHCFHGREKWLLRVLHWHKCFLKNIHHFLIPFIGQVGHVRMGGGGTIPWVFKRRQIRIPVDSSNEYHSSEKQRYYCSLAVIKELGCILFHAMLFPRWQSFYKYLLNKMYLSEYP